jgi:ATP-dependent DNA helicase DinG
MSEATTFRLGPGRASALTVDDVLGPSSPLARRLAGYEVREGQLEMARAVGEALGGSGRAGHLFVEAGTGTGKTFAYLLPAALSHRRIVISTATRALQEQIFERDLPIVRDVLTEHGIEVSAALMKGLPNYLCKRRLSERLRSGEAMNVELELIERWASLSEAGDRAELSTLGDSSQAWRDVESSAETRIGPGCAFYDECFVTRMRERADAARIVVVNHHLFFADLALKTGKTGGYGGAIPPYDAVIFDEAHQLESVATEFFGVKLSTARIERLLRDGRRALAGARLLDSASMRFFDDVEASAHVLFSSWATMAGARRDDTRAMLSPADWTSERLDATKTMGESLAALMEMALAVEEDDAMAMIARRARDLRADLARIAETSEKPLPASLRLREPLGFEGGVTWLDVRDRSVSLGASPVEVGPLLREKLLDRVESVVFTSATLATHTHAGPSFHYARSRLGASPDAHELVVPSPFDFSARAGFYVASDLPEPTSPGFDEASADRVSELLDVTKGGAFVLCTSHRSMRAMSEKLRARAGEHGPLLVQGQAPKLSLLDRFREAGNAVLVATMSFWEGVDVPGRALRLVVIDKIPFAVPTDPVVAARASKIDAEGGNSFLQYSVPAAAITLKQGFGRLIRTRRDAGIVCLLDRRALKRGYGRVLLGSLPPARQLRSVDAVRDFWRSID